MQTFLAQVALIFAAVALGSFLRTVGLFSKQDAKAAGLAITYGTLPSLMLQTLMTYGFLGLEGAGVAASALLLNLCLAGAAWFAFRSQRLPDRSLLTAAAIGAAVGSPAYGFVEAAFGPIGLHLAVLWDLGNLLAVSLLGYAVLAGGGSPTPKAYVHADGGTYRGQWRAGRKHGLGTYRYPGGGEYRGRWADNVKQGPGVYYFPKGGWYEGEWRGGQRRGLGLRVMRSGAVQAGEWDGTVRTARLEPGECALAAASAREVARAAAELPVSRGLGAELPARLLAQPAVWAAGVALLCGATPLQLPVVADLVTAHLATAHVPLSLAVFGLSLELDALPRGRQARLVAGALAVRLLGPLLLGALATGALARRYTDAVAIAAVCALGPLSEQVPWLVQLFRLNAQLGEGLVSATRVASLAGLTLLTFAMVLATPVDALISRTGLAAALAACAAVMSAAGGVAAWVLSSAKTGPARGSRAAADQAQPLAGEAPPAPAAAAAAADIPIGIAWQEAGDSGSETGSSSDGSTDAEAAAAAEAVWPAVESSEGTRGSQQPAAGPSGGGEPGQPGPSSRRGRRRQGRAFEDVEDELAAEVDSGSSSGICNGPGPAGRRRWACEAARPSWPLAVRPQRRLGSAALVVPRRGCVAAPVQRTVLRRV